LSIVDASFFEKNEELEQLDISGCEITDLWPNSKQPLKSLKLLNAARNKIQVVTLDTMKITPSLIHLDLSGNKFICNGLFTDLAKYMKKNEISDLPFKASESKTSWLTTCELDYDGDEETYDESDKDFTIDDGNDADNTDEDDDDADDDDDDDDELSDEDDDYSLNDLVFNKYNDVIEDDVQEVPAMDTKDIVAYLLPTLVFFLTALIVLVITVAILLFILHRKGNKRPSNYSHIQLKVPTWGAGKIKMHSGSVYRPLSEEKLPTIP
jgi:hypothetical protein